MNVSKAHLFLYLAIVDTLSFFASTSILFSFNKTTVSMGSGFSVGPCFTACNMYRITPNSKNNLIGALDCPTHHAL